MKQVPDELKTLLESGVPLYLADLYTVTLHDESVQRWTTWDHDLTRNDIFYSYGPLIQRNGVRCVAGLEVDTLDLTMMVGDSVTLGGINIQLAAVNGIFDDARVMLECAFMVTPGTISGTIVMFEGRVSDVKPSSTAIQLSVKSELERLNIMQPHTIFSPQCQNCLYDDACDATLQLANGVVATGTTSTSIVSNISEDDGFYGLGVVTMIDGPAAGATRAVRGWSSNIATLVTALPDTPTVGDRFTIYPGCDHKFETCQLKFGNDGNYRGFPFVPRAETAR